MPAMPAPPPPPPPPPAPPPAPVSAGQKVATIQSKASTKGAMDKTKGTAAFAAPTPKIQTIQGQTTGLNVPAAQ